ncbi:hypothetical protein Tco_0422135 [Tanacetum coccineum]
MDETPPPPKTSPLEDDELVEEEAIKICKIKPIGNDLEDISLENNQIVNIKESKTHPLENIIDNDSDDGEVLNELIEYKKRGNTIADREKIIAYNTIMVEGLEGTGKNLVAIVKDVYVFVGSFTYITDFVVLEDIGEFIMSDID